MKINKFCVCFLIILSGIIILIPKVKANEILPGAGLSFQIGTTIYVDSEHNSLPYSNLIYANNTLNLGALQVSYSGASVSNPYDNPTYNYLYLSICQSNSYLRMNISNSSTIHSYFVTGQYSGYDTGTTCTTQGYNGKEYLFMIPVGKWEYGEISEWFEVASYNSFSSANGIYFTINRVFLSDEDLVATYRTQAELNNKLNSINTAITNMQNNITTNQNTNTQNIINNQNTNAQQAHNDSVNTQNTIKDDSIDSPNNSINTIKGSLANNGVITSLVVLPVTLYQAILNSVNGTCSTFSLGSLYGTNLTIPCINVSNYLGTTLWGSIDVIISGIFIYMISRKMVKVFHQLSSLKEGDVLDG